MGHGCNHGQRRAFFAGAVSRGHGRPDHAGPGEGVTRRAAASQLRGQYLVQNPLWRTWLQWYDAWLSLTADRRTRPLPNVAPRRILVCVGGHLGYAVLG